MVLGMAMATAAILGLARLGEEAHQHSERDRNEREQGAGAPR
jgi:hypothetical protein